MNISFAKGLLFVLLILTGPVSAFHIVGGDINMNNLGRPGYFRLTLNQYWDEAGIARNTGQVTYETSITVYVFSLRTRQSVEKFVLRQADKQPLTYRNQACAQTTGLRTSEVHYTADVQFTTNRYTDSQGYYIVWERCCRNSTISNIETPGQVGQVFYLEFPAMQPNGVNFTNSSPAFHLPNGEYICVNKPFRFDFSASDQDGDELRYQLVTPWSGYTSTRQILADGLSYPSYPTITWLAGYSDQAMIPGPSPLKVDAGTGQLSVTAGQQGLFVFAVEVTEYRNGVAIGKVRREFQLFVTDCATNVPPPAVVLYKGQPAKTIEFCQGNTVPLVVDDNPKWAYQWQKDGSNLTGATNATLVAQGAGTYTVIKSLVQTCSRDTASEAVQVIQRTDAVVKITPDPSLTVCMGASVKLQANPTNGTFRWSSTRPAVTSLSTASFITVTQPGLYTVNYTEAGNPCPGHDSVTVVVNPLPLVTITGRPAVLCGTDSTILSTTAVAGNRYRWTRNGASSPTSVGPTLTATQTGTYQVRVTDVNGCASTADFMLSQTAKPVVRFDSLTPLCNSQGPAVALVAQPPGGLFSGTGVSGNSFDPRLSGSGRFAVLYSYTDVNGCQSQQKRFVDVQTPIGLTVPDSLLLIGGDSVKIPATVRVPITTVSWSPATGLNSVAVLQPKTGTRSSITYTVTVATRLGCVADAHINVRIFNRLLLPTAFTPNSDGRNDTWEIHGIDSFLQAEVFIYDRWGSVIYHSVGYDQPWDGTYQGQRVEPGAYTYRVLTNIESVRYTGHVLVVY